MTCAVLPSSAILPAYMTMIRSAIWAMTPMSWVMKINPAPFCRTRLESSVRICAWMVTSRLVVGSSAISSLGSQASAMAIMQRCCMPPLNWCG